MASHIIALLLTVSFCVSDPPEIALTESVDLIELNHYFGDAGKPVFDQLIFYNWDTNAGRYNVVAWRLIKNQNQTPIMNPRTKKYFIAWHDSKVLRVVHAADKLETWTQYDPETVERRFYPKSLRMDLLRIQLQER